MEEKLRVQIDALETISNSIEMVNLKTKIFKAQIAIAVEKLNVIAKSSYVSEYQEKEIVKDVNDVLSLFKKNLPLVEDVNGVYSKESELKLNARLNDLITWAVTLNCII